MKKKKGPTPKRGWGDWRDVPRGETTREEVHRIVENDRYQVHMSRMVANPETGWPDMIWLSIKRLDQKPVHDWRDLQRIKNELVGGEYEGMEIYPAEERLVDSANQYHLWIVEDPSFRWPWGFNERFVLTPEEAVERFPGAKQRPFAT